MVKGGIILQKLKMVHNLEMTKINNETIMIDITIEFYDKNGNILSPKIKTLGQFFKKFLPKI